MAAHAAWEAVVLGVAQDAGVPHPGCACTRCEAAHRGDAPRLHAACLGLSDGRRTFLVDATPDLPAQLREMGAPRPDGVFLTHAHMGHVAGLLYLGREALATSGVALHATPAMHAFLRANAPWRDLEDDGRVVLRSNACVDLGGLVVEAVPVPHRAEHGDTVGYRVRGPSRTLLYVPDIDSWGAWDRDVREEVESVDVALLDATFLAADELPNRDPGEVPHPLVTDTMERLAGLGDRVRLTHVNHTNALLTDPSPAASRGFRIAVEGERIPL